MKHSLLRIKQSCCIGLVAGFACNASAAGGPGNALWFINSTPGTVTVPHHVALNAYPISVTFWLNTSLPFFFLPEANVLSKSFGSSDGWAVYILNDQIRAAYSINAVNHVGGGGAGLNGGSIVSGTWRHVAFTVDASGGKLYVDGVLRETRAWTGAAAATSTTAPLHFGYVAFFPGTVYHGFLEEISIWNVALTQAQIQANKNRSLTGAEPGLVAYYRCDESAYGISTDSAPASGLNNGTWTGDIGWTSSSVQPFSPSVETSGVSPTGTNSATLLGRANPSGTNTMAWFEWGTTTNYGNVTPTQALGGGAAYVNFSHVLTNLSPRVIYHFRAIASNALGVAVDVNRSFLLPAPPLMATLAPTTIETNTATLNGVIEAELSAGAYMWFEWGTTTNYGNTTPAQSTAAGSSGIINYSNVIAGLSEGVTYHFRAAGSNHLGQAYGTNRSFTTLGTLRFADIGAGLPGISFGASAWGDYDNDGRLDILVAGALTSSNTSTRIWRNTPAGFTASPISLTPIRGDVRVCALAWGDANNDGWLDVLLAGSTNGTYAAARSQVWTNLGGSSFSLLPVALRGVISSTTEWGDYDNDGRLDFLLAGFSAVEPFFETGLWRNTGSGFSQVNAMLPAFSDGGAEWADYDEDGRSDLLLGGVLQATHVLRNTAAGFVDAPVSPPPWSDGSVAWGDYDNDGRLDFLISGGSTNGPITQLWRNTGGTFVQVPVPGLPGVQFSSATWGDYDNDGRLDFVITGTTVNGYPPNAADRITQLWRNNGSGFTRIDVPLPGVMIGSANWGDYDNDGRLDILLIGTTTNGTSIARIYRNHTPTPNTPPSVPSGLAFSVSDGAAVFSWNASTDAQTPSAGLTYNVRAGSTPGGIDLISPHASAAGLRRLPARGNAESRQFAFLNGLTNGQSVYWSVQAIDTSFAASPFAAERSFRLVHATLPVTSTNRVYGDLNGDGLIDQTELNNLLAPYFATSPLLLMTNVAGLGTSNVTFALSDSLAGSFSVEYTTNLMEWYFLGPAATRYEFNDTNAPAGPQRYYRLRWP